jgi:hypothetical protein
MFEKNSGTDIFSLERTPRSSSAPLLTEQYFPYESAWKEFDRLQKTARGGRPIRWLMWVFGVSMGIVGFYGFRLMKGSKLIILICWGAAGVIEIFYWFNGKRRFLHGQCPRCHSEWPGVKNEKDRACKGCGLRLHQLFP